MIPETFPDLRRRTITLPVVPVAKGRPATRTALARALMAPADASGRAHEAADVVVGVDKSMDREGALERVP
jgi:hypothetical protein